MSLSRPTVAKINEWVKWFNWHADKIASQPLPTKVEWLLKATNGAYECMALVARETHAQKRTFDMSDGGIALPNGYRWEKRNGA